MSRSERNDLVTVRIHRCARRHYQAPIWSARNNFDLATDLVRITSVNWKYLHPDRGRHRLDYGELADAGSR
jgi:hypothetical protein